MKRIVPLLALIACSQFLRAQIPSSCNVPVILTTHYDIDLKHLALKRLTDLKSPAMDSIRIPESYQDTIRNGMAAIFNLNSLKERDSVFDHYCIHQAISNYLFRRIYVAVDKDYMWTQKWKNLITVTGIPALDNLLSTYGFTVSSFSSIATYAVLETNQTINVKPLCDSLKTFAGVFYAEPQPINGAGNEISYTKTGDDRFYDFTVGYGDCQSGCLAKHTFKFKVSANCSVDYLGVVDILNPPYTLPKPVNCNISGTAENKKLLAESIKIYPNPVNTALFVESVHEGKIEIFNLQGQLILTAAIQQNPSKVDVTNLPGGVYTLKISAGKEVRVQKITKE